MSRSRLPPTPAMSGEFIVKDHHPSEGPDAFSLPPAALTPANTSRESTSSSKDNSLCYPASPTSPDLVAVGNANPNSINPRANQTRQAAAQTGTKRRLDDLDLPPPPTRTRKIIQMKPKTQSQSQSQSQSKPAAGKQKDSNTSKSTTSGPSNSTSTSTSNSNSASKKKQSGNQSGRKMARKTAHSLIERRRRSKMNEEFGTLKDMIPACRGQEMHKLAILQASIDYVNYLEECIQDLKAPDVADKKIMGPPPGPPSPTSPDVLSGIPAPDGSTYYSEPASASVSPDLVPSSTENNTSPSFSANAQTPGPVEFATILPSPVLGPSSQSADSRNHHHGYYHSHSWPASQTLSAQTSPAMQPQRDDYVDHEASAALLMLNRDRRGTAESIGDRFGNTSLASERRVVQRQEPRKTGMSVKDLLIS